MSLIQGFLDGLRPVPILTVADWADQNRVLTSESSAEPGRWRTSRTPYLKQIFEDLSPTSPIQEVIVMKGAQLGFSESAINMVGCYMDISPCPIMYVMPTIAIAEQLSKDRIDPMIENCESLKRKVPSKRDRDGGNTTLQKIFPGGRLALAGANSAATLRSRAVRVLGLDEVDAYPIDVEGEGSPVNLAKKRTNTFGSRKKMYQLSTPTVQGKSVIEKAYLETEQQKYHVPCPECGAFQELLFEQLRWEPGDFDSVRYECTACGERFEERHKPRFLAAGVWVATYPEKQKPFVRGYHMNSLYSPLGWLSWADIVQEWEEAQKDETKLKTFINTVKGETYAENAEVPQWEALYSRREQYELGTVPIEVGLITAGVDVQRDRIELEIVGWCSRFRSYSIDYRVIQGDTSGTQVWNDLAKMVTEQFPREDGELLPIRMMAIDSGFNSLHVYQFTARFGNDKTIAIKGVPRQQRILSAPQPCNIGRNGQRVSGVKRWNIGVDLLKAELYGWLRQYPAEGGEEPTGYCHFPEHGEWYFKGLTAEKLVYKLNNKGYQVAEWYNPPNSRNEPLDCRVYARAAATFVGIDRWTDEDWEALKGQVAKNDEVKKASERKRSSFLGRWKK